MISHYLDYNINKEVRTEEDHHATITLELYHLSETRIDHPQLRTVLYQASILIHRWVEYRCHLHLQCLSLDSEVLHPRTR